MGSISRKEQFLLVAGVFTSGLIIRASASCQIGSPTHETADFSSSGVGVCFDGIGGDDTIIGSAFDDTITGGGGDDDVTGGDGLDYIGGEAGADWVDAGGDRDTVIGGNGSDPSLGGGADTDLVQAGNSSDGIDGGAARDTLEGNGGADTILGEGGPDVIEGGTGSDVLWGNDDDDSVYDYVRATPYASDASADVCRVKGDGAGDSVWVGEDDSVCADGADSIFVYDSLGNSLFAGPFDDGSGSDYESSGYLNSIAGC